jgi:hypothetical protein
MGDRAWVREIARKLREDMGDCPTLPEEMLDLLRRFDGLPPSAVHRDDAKTPATREKGRHGR